MNDYEIHEAISFLNIHYLDENGEKIQINPAIVSLYLENKLENTLHIAEINKLPDDQKSLLTLENLKAAAEASKAQIEAKLAFFESERLRKIEKVKEKFRLLNLDDEDIKTILWGI